MTPMNLMIQNLRKFHQMFLMNQMFLKIQNLQMLNQMNRMYQMSRQIPKIQMNRKNLLNQNCLLFQKILMNQNLHKLDRKIPMNRNLKMLILKILNFLLYQKIQNLQM